MFFEAIFRDNDNVYAYIKTVSIYKRLRRSILVTSTSIYLCMITKIYSAIHSHLVAMFISTISNNLTHFISFCHFDMVSDRIIEKKIPHQKARGPTAACFSIINYSCKKWGIISKRHLQHFPLHSKNFL